MVPSSPPTSSPPFFPSRPSSPIDIRDNGAFEPSPAPLPNTNNFEGDRPSQASVGTDPVAKLQPDVTVHIQKEKAKVRTPVGKLRRS
jgi:hypothetical protein